MHEPPTTSPDERTSVRNRALNAALLASPGDLDLTIAASRIEGRVPPELQRGRLLSNGPGWTQIGGRLAHPFDGHGYVRAFSFERDGAVRLRARFVETPVYREERAAGHVTRRGLGVNPSDLFWKNVRRTGRRNVANTTVQRWNGALLASWEGGAPFRLDPDSLATRGEETFGGALADQATLAHLKLDASAQRLVSCSVEMGRHTTLTFREIDRSGNVLSSRAEVMPHPAFIHDFVITPRWYGVLSNPVRLRPGALARAVMGTGVFIDAVGAARDAPGTLYLIPRAGDALRRTIALPHPAFAVHYANAFEREGEVVLDACIAPDIDFSAAFGFQGPHAPLEVRRSEASPPSRLVRVVVNDGASTGTWEQRSPYGIDFPRIHPEHDGIDTAFALGAARADPARLFPFDSIARIDLTDPARPTTLWTASEDVFVGEPIFAPSPDRADAGHVLAILYDGVRASSSLAIFDVNALTNGPLARVPLPLLPYAFHGAWDVPE